MKLPDMRRLSRAELAHDLGQATGVFVKLGMMEMARAVAQAFMDLRLQDQTTVSAGAVDPRFSRDGLYAISRPSELLNGERVTTFVGVQEGELLAVRPAPVDGEALKQFLASPDVRLTYIELPEHDDGL
jgi:hypothetical protein